jgi:tRNA-uridine 2-sulfurtransferase
MVALSGGVDSAVALLLLRDQGLEVEALFMKNWDEDDVGGECPVAEDLADAEAICAALGVRLHTVNLSAEYWERVFERFLADCRAGLTPNPDVLCNREVKFSAFVDHAADLGAAWIATGHYARIRRGRRGTELWRAVDEDKDQSYFLHGLEAAQLERVLFPLGALTKDRVRDIARGSDLPVAAKRDSTGVCFIGERPFRAFLERYIAPRPGDVVTLEGEPIGRHRGIGYYTIGQRRGLGLGGHATGNDEAWYVAGKEIATGRLRVAQGRDHPALWSRRVEVGPLHYIGGSPPGEHLRVRARLRHRHRPQPCRVVRIGSERWQVDFDEPQWAAAPGQYVVLYEGERCLGGGAIVSSTSLAEEEGPLRPASTPPREAGVGRRPDSGPEANSGGRPSGTAQAESAGILTAGNRAPTGTRRARR